MARRTTPDDGISSFHSRLRGARDDEHRLKLYVEFLRMPGATDPHMLLKEADTALLVKTLYKYPILAGTIFCLRAHLCAGTAIGNDIAARKDLDKAASYAGNASDLEGIRLRMEIAQLYEELCGYDKAMDIYERICSMEFTPLHTKGSRREIEEWEDNCTELRAEACYRLGSLRFLHGAFSDALTMHQRGCELRESLLRPDLVAASLAAMARVHAVMNDKKAKELVVQSLKAAQACAEGETAAHPVAESFEHLAEAELARGRHDISHRHLTFARTLYQKLDDRIGTARTFILEGRLCEASSDFSIAIQRYTTAYQILDTYGAWRLLPSLLIAMGRALRGKKQDDKALFPFQQAAEIAARAHDVRAERDALLELSETLENLGQWQNALKRYKEASAITQKLGDEQHRRALARLQYDFDVRQARNLEEQLRKAQRNVGRGRQEVKAATTRLGLQSEKLRALHREVRRTLSALDDRNTKRLKEKLKNIEFELGKELQASNDSWRSLLKRVLDVDIDCIERLRQHYPNLTKAELEVCGLELLGRTAAEIAEARGSAIRTVYKQRECIRRKCSCPTTMSLENFLKSICT